MNGPHFDLGSFLDVFDREERQRSCPRIGHTIIRLNWKVRVNLLEVDCIPCRVKKDGSLLFCVDYRKNALTKRDRYPIPLIDEVPIPHSSHMYQTISFCMAHGCSSR